MAELTLVLLTLVVVSVIAFGVARGVAQGGGRRAAAIVVTLLALWLALAAALALSGLIANWSSPPPRWPLLPLTAFVIIFLVTRSSAAGRVLSNIPPWCLIAAQSFRVLVEGALFALYLEGRAPVQITFEGRNFDILVGLSAPIVAVLLAKRRIGKAAVVIWNVLGLLVLANTVGTVATSTPGPLHLAWPGAPLTAVAEWPIVWLPAFLMPFAVFLHVSSLRQMRSLPAPVDSRHTR